MEVKKIDPQVRYHALMTAATTIAINLYRDPPNFVEPTAQRAVGKALELERQILSALGMSAE